jgi:tetratricopeptide (TPR) repeat protein
LYTALGALAVAQIPLTEAQLSNLTGQTELSMTLKRLHQLLDLDETLPLSQRTYALYHRSFIDFLLDKDRSEEYGRDEKREHLHLANWCEKGNVSIIWEDVKYSPGEQGRREYARKYYVTHLYLSQEWQQPQKQRLFEILDTVQFGQAKIRNDPSTRSYTLDLDLGRQATTWEGWTLEEGIALLPRLWQYTLLRCSLTSRADQYPEEAFRLLVLLGRTQEALGLAELLTYPAKKVRVLRYIAEQLREQAKEGSAWLELLMRAIEVARTIRDRTERASALRALGTTLVQAGQWTEAERVIRTIQDKYEHARALSNMAITMARTDKLEKILHLTQRSWRLAETRGEAFTLFTVAIAVISNIPDIGKDFLSALSWVDNFLGG